MTIDQLRKLLQVFPPEMKVSACFPRKKSIHQKRFEEWIAYLVIHQTIFSFKSAEEYIFSDKYQIYNVEGYIKSGLSTLDSSFMPLSEEFKLLIKEYAKNHLPFC